MKFLLSLSLKVKIIITACAVAAAAVAVGTVIALNSDEAYRVIKVFEIDGSATVTRENAGDIDAYAGMNLESGDVLSVGENSTLRVSLDSDKYILLDGGTVLEFIAQGTSADSRTVINLRNGTILNEIKNSLSANSSYEVNTPKATMAVRGTIFTVTTVVNPDGSYTTTVHTDEGKVSVQLLDENGEPKGKEVYVPAGGAVTIRAEVNSETGNPADVDGESYFVFPNDDGSFTPCGDSGPVYYPGGRASAETQTEQTAADVPSGTETTEISSTVPETEAAVTTVPVHEAVLTVSDIPAVTTAPPESSEPKPVTPSESDTSVVTPAEATEAAVPETTTVASEVQPQNTKNEKNSVTTSDAATTAAVTAGTRPFYPVTTSPVYTYPTAQTIPVTTALSDPTTVPTATPPPITTTEPSETTVPDTETEPPETTSQTAVYKVNFTDENGNVISEAEYEENEIVGTLPQIADKKGYTGKWVCGGEEITENTVISSDMEITAEYVPRTVTVEIIAPHSNDPFNTYDTVLSFTVLYDSKLTDNAEGYNIASLTEYVENLYADYFAEHGKVAELKDITFSGYGGEPVTDNSLIAGDNVYENGSELCVSVCFNYKTIDDT